jgi:hypothetical protein
MVGDVVYETEGKERNDKEKYVHSTARHHIHDM